MDNIIISRIHLKTPLAKLDLFRLRPGRGLAIVVVSVGKHDTSESGSRYFAEGKNASILESSQ